MELAPAVDRSIGVVPVLVPDSLNLLSSFAMTKYDFPNSNPLSALVVSSPVVP